MYQPEIETMDRERLERLQLERLKPLLKRVYERIPFYHASFDEAGFDPEGLETLDDLRKAPFTVKQDLRDNYPFGMFAVPRDEVVRIHASSGTTGTATVVGYTQADLDAWSDCFARAVGRAHGTKDSTMQVAYGYGLFTGGLGAHMGGERFGATVVPMSTGNTKRQVNLMRDFDVDILACTPSYAMHIADTALEMGIDPATDLKVSGMICGAEPMSDELRRELEQKMGAQLIDIYGLSEVMGPGVACECELQDGLHLAEDHFIAEIVDPDTFEPVPDGQWGELVITTLSKECSPLIRYRTRDITRILPGECACGCTHRRIDRIRGRTDDMLIIRGVNVFPRQVEEVITAFPEVSAWYQLVVSTRGDLDAVDLNVEVVPEFDFDTVREVESLQRRIRAALKGNLQIAVNVRVVEPKTIERAESKQKRVIDLRKRG
ncbi:MAG: phenylacetate--CoA ligase [Atopobiaceae bacterium]|jgi:phenylacetate-CoA ligase|nr:phenylacetate--CoA ligase [Atopobiaceae bacterium]